MYKSILFFLSIVCAVTFVVHPLFGTRFGIVLLPFIIIEEIKAYNSSRDKEEVTERRRFSLGSILFLCFFGVLYRLLKKYFFVLAIYFLLTLISFNASLEEHEIISIPSGRIGGEDLPPEIRREIRNQIPGFLTIDIPIQMVVQEEYLGKVCITQIPNTPCIKRNEIPLQAKRIRTSYKMEAILRGPNFQIKPVNNKELLVTNIRPTKWNWLISPLQSGKQKIYLRISLLLMGPNGKEIPDDLELETLTIDVQNNFIKEVSKIVNLYGIPLLTLLSLFFLFLILKRRIRKVNTLVLNSIQGFTESLVRETRRMAEKQNHQIFHFETINGSVNAGGKVGNQNYTQKNFNQDTDNQTLSEIRQFLELLQQQQKIVSGAEQIDVIDVEFEQIHNKEPEKWQKWMTCLRVAFAGGIETAKVLNPWAGVPIEVLKGLYEAYQKSRKRHSFESNCY